MPFLRYLMEVSGAFALRDANAIPLILADRYFAVASSHFVAIASDAVGEFGSVCLKPRNSLGQKMMCCIRVLVVLG